MSRRRFAIFIKYHIFIARQRAQRAILLQQSPLFACLQNAGIVSKRLYCTRH